MNNAINNIFAAAKSLQSCPTLCDPIDSSPPGFPIPGILQVRTLEWVPISFSNAWKWKVKVKSLSRVQLCATPWTAAYQARPSMGFSRQGYWSGVPLPSPKHNAENWNLFSLVIKLTLDFKELALFALFVPLSAFTLLLPFSIVFSHFPLLMRALCSLPANNDPGLLNASLCCAFLY